MNITESRNACDYLISRRRFEIFKKRVTGLLLAFSLALNVALIVLLVERS